MAALLFTAACQQSRGDEALAPCDEIVARGSAAERSQSSVILIVNDTMRRDRLGAYGGPARTPAFDAFARENLLFEKAYTQSPWTKPSISTLFTGLYPSQHRVATDPQLRNPFDTRRTGPIVDTDVLDASFETLAEAMKAAGYDTAAFVSNPWMEKRFGFDQGFDVYDDSFAQWGASGEQVSRAALAWLAERPPGKKFFLYVHYLDSHLPYGALDRAELARHAEEIAADKRPLNEQATAAVKTIPRFADGRSPLAEGYAPALSLFEMAYDSGIANFDRALGLLLDGFAGHWAHDEAVVLITADHGEELFEKGYGNHGTGLYDGEVAIPLAVRLPHAGARRAKIDCPVGLVDVMPTLCRYLGLACPAASAGVSFVVDGTTRARAPRYLVSEGVVKQPEHRAIRNATYKLLWETGMRGDGSKKDNPYSLYDFADDPGETRDLLAPEHHSAEADRVFETMKAALHEAVPGYDAPAGRRAPLDAQTLERLRALGYAEAP